jgi:hypothetical protein
VDYLPQLVELFEVSVGLDMASTRVGDTDIGKWSDVCMLGGGVPRSNASAFGLPFGHCDGRGQRSDHEIIIRGRVLLFEDRGMMQCWQYWRC